MERIIKLILEQFIAGGIAFAIGCLLAIVYLVGTGDLPLHTM